MDIWQWVRDAIRELRANGHDRLADIVGSTPRLSKSKTRAELEALVQEGVALARSLQLPWIELFLRHWQAQCVILGCQDVSSGLDDVIRLLDFAHTDAAHACPQSICVCQDVCCAYSVVDGPGYAAERLAASAETLARIDASWPCFDCISTQHASALIDADRLEEAEAFCQRQQTAMYAANAGRSRHLAARLCAVYSLQGQHEKALQALGEMPGKSAEASEKMSYRLRKSRELALLGRREEARQCMVAVEEIEPRNYVSWAEAAQAWCAVGCMDNDFKLGLTVRGFARTLRKHGARYEVAELGLIAAELAMGRGSHALARLHLDDVRSMVPLLRKPERVLEELDRLQSLLLATTDDVLEPASILQQLGEHPEQNLQALQPVIERFPEDTALLDALCNTYAQLDFGELSVPRLQRFIANHPDSIDSIDLLLRMLLENEDAAALAQFVETATEAVRPRALFYQARLFERKAQWEQCVQALQRARQLEPDIQVVNSALAMACRHTQRWEEALELLDELVEGPDTQAEHWERMIVATALGRFDVVRESARHLEFEFDGEGPIDEFIAYCDIVARDHLGREAWYYARRISPVVARIVEIARPGVEPAFGDEILFDPVAINQDEQADAEEERCHAFRAINILRRGGYRTYELDGMHPGDAAVEGLRAVLREQRIFFSVQNSDEYEVTRPGTSDTVPGVFIFVAVPADISATAWYALLIEHTRDWTITCRGLLKELDLQDELQRQERLAQEMGL